MSRPVCLLDVDGVLNVFDADVTPDTGGRLWSRGVEYTCLDHEGVSLLWRKDLPEVVEPLRLAFDIVWLTSWGRAANDLWPAAMGCSPETFEVINVGPYRGIRDGLSYKAPFVRQWIDQRPGTRGVWFDDELGGREAELVPEVTPVRTWPMVGLEPEIVAAVVAREESR